MGKQLKKATKKKNESKVKKKNEQVKKKKQFKKLGLAKYIQSNTRPKNPKLSAKHKDDSDKNGDCGPKAKLVHNLAKRQKDLSLVDRCRLQMSSSLLRLVDEKLYTCDSSIVALTKDEFIAYHDAYSKASERWPTKPIDYIVKFIKKRLFTKKPVNKLKFADIGCGREPLLKMKLPHKAKVQSFDLVSTHDDVVQANMDNLPIEDESIHCAVYSLSLMAKNLGKILIEARRVLKLGGSLLIIEVTSRFEGRQKRFVEKVEKIGFKKRSMAVLKPNGFFTFFHFTKIEAGKYSGFGVNIELKPCVYKAR